MSDRWFSRRSLVAALGSAGISTIAGCSSGEGTSPTSRNTRSATATPTEPESSTPTDTEEPTATPHENPDTTFVGPNGDDSNPGTRDAPLSLIKTALQATDPGETVYLLPGEYHQAILTMRDGEPGKPITITGPADAVVRPPPPEIDTPTLVNIQHNHFHLRGLSLNGLIEPDRKFEDHGAYVTRCVSISPVGRFEEGIDYLNDVVVEPAGIGYASGPLIQTQRIRNASIGNFKVIGPAGMAFDRRVDNFEHGHVREIVYIGSPETHRNEPFYKYETLDRSRNIRIHHIDNSAGYPHNELVDVKLGSSNVTVEYCTDRNAGHNTEGTVSAALDIKGNNCTIRWNDIQDCPVPISFGAWGPSDDIDQTEWSRNNAVYGNVIRNFAAGPFRLRDKPEWDIGPASFEAQRVICGNEIGRGDPPIDPWVPPTNGYDGTVADRRGQDEIEITVEESPDGFRHVPPAVFVDPDTTVTWKWDENSGKHYIVRDNRWMHDTTIPDPNDGPQSHEHGDVGMKRWAGSIHHDEGARTTVITVGPEDRHASARNDCTGDVPEGDGIGHLGGDSPWA